jgi:hypothetical protein
VDAAFALATQAATALCDVTANAASATTAGRTKPTGIRLLVTSLTFVREALSQDKPTQPAYAAALSCRNHASRSTSQGDASSRTPSVRPMSKNRLWFAGAIQMIHRNAERIHFGRRKLAAQLRRLERRQRIRRNKLTNVVRYGLIHVVRTRVRIRQTGLYRADQSRLNPDERRQRQN